MNILDEIKELKEKLNALESKANKFVKINDIAVGEQFVYCGYTYTKLNEENFCIIDDYDDNFMSCQFDPITNNYDESLIRHYINSNRFIKRLEVNKADIKPHYKDDLITLLSKEEYEKYKGSIECSDDWWTTRTAGSCYAYGVYGIPCGIIDYCSIHNVYWVRVCFNLDPNTPVICKDNE